MSVVKIPEILKQKEGSIPKKILKVLEIELVRSVRMNFAKQGRPERWKPKLITDGRKILSGKSGDLFSSISSSISENRITVLFGTNYAEIHNRGGRIGVTKKMRKFFWAKYYETKKEVWKKLALTKKGYIEIPKREFALLTEEDLRRIITILQRNIKNII